MANAATRTRSHRSFAQHDHARTYLDVRDMTMRILTRMLFIGYVESGGAITSANLGIMCLRSPNANLYHAMKERYGGLKALLLKFPHR